ncbi:phage head completion protein [Sphingomonas jatrophae]|uniref:Head-tail adaptor n=1 Tax=Sphingomonas jatrophae TaxID=1166337 RepID=A0A1I6L439_9SPHN|nr:head-tail adaptor protein [Sphingomonas jatrophae]SFR98048.1 head-tail adaptor [Sphingomonas jatrophae]
MSGGLAGTLRERVTVLRQGAERDALGGAAGDWVEVARVWAAPRPERSVASKDGAVRGALRWTVALRPCPVAVGDRLARGDGLLAVTAVERDPATPDRILVHAEEVA